MLKVLPSGKDSDYHEPMTLANLVREERNKRGWSRSELARRSKVTPSVITRLEESKRLGRADTIARVADALGIDPEIVSALLSERVAKREMRGYDVSHVPKKNLTALDRSIKALIREFEEDE